MPNPLSQRETLLHFNAGVWEGTFLRLDGNGRELERFGSLLNVSDRAGTIHADLTNRSTGVVRSMQFDAPPAEMQISPDGHWSLGPDRIGAWSWVCELCLVWGHRRRRIVVRHHSTGLESLVLVCEGRQGSPDEAPEAPLQLTPRLLSPQRSLWSLTSPLDVEIGTLNSRGGGEPESVSLQWQPEPGRCLRLERRYDAYGLLEPLTPSAGAD